MDARATRFLGRRWAALLLLVLAWTAAAAQQAAPAEAVALESRIAEIDGQWIHYRIAGSGPHLLMLHGFTRTGDQWSDHAAAFLSTHTVVLADLPGHGGSSAPEGGFRFEQAARLMHGLLDRLGAERASGIGHSAGAMTLLHMAAQRPDRIEAIVLVAGPDRMGPEAKDVVRDDRFEDLPPRIQEFYRGIHPGGQEQLDWIFREYNGLAGNDEAVSAETLAGLPARALLVWGDRDPYFPIEMAVEIYRTMPNAALWVIPGQRHAPIWSVVAGGPEAGRIFDDTVRSFLDGKGWR